jgi:PAS domain S-box-containing protein
MQKLDIVKWLYWFLLTKRLLYRVEYDKLKHIDLAPYKEDKSVVDKTLDEENADVTVLRLTGKWAEAFGDSHSRFATLFSKMLTAIAYYKVITDENGKPLHYICLEANEAFERITGIKRKSYLGKKATNLWLTNGSNLHKVIDTYGRVSLVQESLQFEYQMDPLKKWYNISAFSVEKGYFVTIFEDITERKVMEEALRQGVKYNRGLIEANLDPLVIIGQDGKITDMNRATKKITGRSYVELIGTDFADCFTQPDKARLGYEITLKKGFIRDYELKIKGNNEIETPILYNASVYLNDNGESIGVFASVHDITELKHLQEDLIKSAKFNVIGQLASAVGHELRNPLGVIKNSVYYLNMILKDDADEKIFKHLKILDKKVNSANNIINDLLDITRKKVPTLQLTDLNKTVRNALSNLTVPENIVLDIKLAKIPKSLLDKEQIQRVIQNLIMNSIQAMTEGGKLTIQTTKHDNNMKLIVKDTGVGIPKKDIANLFTPLFTTKAKGIGLGLVICKQLVEGHNGAITVKSEVGEGSEFIVELPIQAEKKITEQSVFTVSTVFKEGVQIEAQN